jgi:dTDP-D-glucose 4,6-dehydratase
MNFIESILASELLIEEYREAYNIPAIINRCGYCAEFDILLKVRYY